MLSEGAAGCTKDGCDMGAAAGVVAVELGVEGDENASLPRRSKRSLVDLTVGLLDVAVEVVVAAETGGADWKSSKSSNTNTSN